ncbi:MAG: type II secretion system F family protein [Planctomycetes bacterium]|nr:type II secretion system F family protein [Planctomycetota bacterium]MBI3832769.1 type II secretion system F family protein [Planctomycetota bacterium]
MLLTYDAIDASGKKATDSIEACGTKEAVDQLRRKGLFVTRIGASTSPSKTPAKSASASRDLGRLPLKQVVQITRQVAMLLRSGSALVPAFSALQRQLTNPKQAALIGKIVMDLEDGATLTDALRKHPQSFDAVYCAIIAAGETSGTLTEMFERLSTIVGKRRAMQKKLIGAMAYPALLIVMCLKIFLVLLFFVVPRFNTMFEQLGVQTPATTQVLLTTGAVLSHYWPLVVLAVAAIVGGIVWLVRSESGRQLISNVQTSIPLVGRLRVRLIQAQIFRTLGMLMESRVNVLEALELVRRSTQNAKFQKLFNSLEESVTAGGRLSSAFNESGLIEPYICQAIHTGEDSGNLGGAMTFVADVLDETNEELITVVVKLLEPLILIVMGLFVGGIAASLFIPLFDLTSAMK